jgi:alkanesulfonate monooxygenase SsuD/methylene tetrahydromethanopterin reductase-like flavin-dependent oxidoreductase (luciferase family)
VKFGVFYEHQVPKPWTGGDERRVFEEALEQAEFLDGIGIHSFWLVEHHFLEEYSHSSAPEIFLAALSQRTKHLRLGHGIMHTPPAINHPARQAERIATLDVVSGGRVEFGTGEGSSAAELDAFGVDPEQKREAWEEGLRVALRCMSETPFTGFAGEHVSMPPRNVVPKP